MTPTQSRPFSTAEMISRWPGRKPVCPNTVRSNASGSTWPAPPSFSTLWRGGPRADFGSSSPRATARSRSTSAGGKEDGSSRQRPRSAWRRPWSARRPAPAEGAGARASASSASTSRRTASRGALLERWGGTEPAVYSLGTTRRELRRRAALAKSRNENGCGPWGPHPLERRDARRLLRDLRVLDDDRVRVAGAEVLLDGDLPLHDDHVAHRGLLGGRDGEVVVLAGGARAVADVDPVPAHDALVVLHDLAADRDRLLLEGGALSEDLGDGPGVRSGRLRHLHAADVARARGRGGVLRGHPDGRGAAGLGACGTGGGGSIRAPDRAEVDDLELALQRLRLEVVHGHRAGHDDLGTLVGVGLRDGGPGLALLRLELEIAVRRRIEPLEHLALDGRRGALRSRCASLLRRGFLLLASRHGHGHQQDDGQTTAHVFEPPNVLRPPVPEGAVH